MNNCLSAALPGYSRLSCLFVVLVATAAIPAQTNTYTPVGPFTWSTAANWNVTPPVGGSATTVLQFNNSGSSFYDALNDLAGTFQLNGLLLNSTSSRVSIISGNALNFTQDGASNNPVLNQNGSSAFVINNNFSVTDPLTIGGTGTGTVVLNGAITNTGGITVSNTGFSVYQGGIISGTGALTKSGAGTLYLFGANSFTGNVNINNGTIAIIGPGGTTDSAALGGSPKTVNIGGVATSGTLQILSGQYDPDLSTKTFSISAGGGTIDVGLGGLFILNANAQLTGSGNLTKSGLGTFRMGSTFAGFTGNVLINEGILNVTNAAAIGGGSATITVSNGATLDIGTTVVLTYSKNITATGFGVDGVGAVVNSSTTLATLTGGISISGGTGIGGNGTGGISVGGSGISGSGGLTKSGINTVTLASNNTFTGATTIRGGTLALSTFTTLTDSRLDSNSIVNLHGGTLSLVGSAGLDMTQTVTGTNVGIGSSIINVTSITGQTTTFDPRGAGGTTNFTRDKGGVVNFTLTPGGGTAVIKVNNANNAGGTIGGWAMFANTTWAINDGAGNIAGLAAFSPINTFPAGGNVDVTLSSAWAASTINSLRISPPSTTAITITQTGTGSISSGGILVGSAFASTTAITGGNLVTTDGANNDLVITNTNANTLTVSSIIGVAGNVTFGVTKAGSGTVTFGATNLYTGGTFIVQGTALASVARGFGALNSQVIIGQGATAAFRSDAAVNFDNDVIISPNALTATINFQQTTTAGTNITHRIRNLTVGSATVGVQTLIFTQASSYRLNVSGTTTLNGNAILSNAAQFVTLTGIVSDGAGSFGISKVGAGTVVFAAANTFNGGVVLSGGTLRVNTNSVLTAGAVSSGSLGTGTLLLAGGTLSDNDAARVFQNKLVINANSGFGSATAGSAGSLTFNSTGLTTPNTIDLITANPILTVNNTTTFNNVVTGANLTKAGTGTLILGADNLYTGTTTVSGGVLQFQTLAALGGSGRSLNPLAGGTAAAGFALDQNFLDRLLLTADGVAALGVSSSNDLDMSAFTALRLGASGSGTVTYTGTLTPAGTTYMLGGGGTTSPVTTPVLNITSLLTGGRSVNVGSNGTAAGIVVLSNTANDYTGGTTFAAGGVLRVDVADGTTPGGTSILGIVPATPTNDLTFTGGTLRYGIVGVNLHLNRQLFMSTGGGTVDTNGLTITLPNLISGSGSFNKGGAGTLNLTNAANTAGGLGVVDVLTIAAGTSLTINGAVAIGNNTVGDFIMGAGTTFTMNGAGSNFVLGNRTTAADNINNLFDGSLASNVSISAATVQIGSASGQPDHTGTGPFVTFTLPTGSTSTSSITATTSILIGIGETNGAGGDLATLNLGGGNNTIYTPFISVGEEKTAARFGFQAGSAGSLILRATLAGGKTDLTIGDNAITGTGTNPNSTFNLVTTGTVTATLGLIELGQGGATTAGGGAKGTFNLGAGGLGSLVTADTVAIGIGGSSTNTSLTGTFNLSAGTFQFNSGGAGFVTGSGTAGVRISVINVSGGVLDMNGKPINPVMTGTGTSTLTLTGGTIQNASTIGAFTSLTFSGGTLLNTNQTAATINRAVTQTGATSVFQINSGAQTTINGAYSLSNGRALINGTLAMGANAITLADGGRLHGTGVVSSSATTGITVNAGGIIQGGNSPGMLTLGASTIVNADGTIRSDFTRNTSPTTPGNTLGDSGFLDVTGTNTFHLAPGAGTFNINLVGDGTDVFNETYKLTLVRVSSVGNIILDTVATTGNQTIPSTKYVLTTSGFANSTVLSSSLQLDSTGTLLQLTVTVVPEPHHLLLMSVAVLLIGLAIRRRFLARIAVSA